LAEVFAGGAALTADSCRTMPATIANTAQMATTGLMARPKVVPLTGDDLPEHRGRRAAALPAGPDLHRAGRQWGSSTV
jgi:hypothetical protein